MMGQRTYGSCQTSIVPMKTSEFSACVSHVPLQGVESRESRAVGDRGALHVALRRGAERPAFDNLRMELVPL